MSQRLSWGSARSENGAPPSAETAAGISLAAQVVCFKLTIDHPHSGLTLALRAIALGLVVGWIVALARGHRTSWPIRITLVSMNVGSALYAVLVAGYG